MKERTISMFAFTKAYAMDGWRLGYLAADKSMISALMKITTTEVTHVNTFVQMARWPRWPDRRPCSRTWSMTIVASAT
jgi:aspartate/methionine/tyrosine aminotransferase